jgi:hypothetical protein
MGTLRYGTRTGKVYVKAADDKSERTLSGNINNHAHSPYGTVRLPVRYRYRTVSYRYRTVPYSEINAAAETSDTRLSRFPPRILLVMTQGKLLAAPLSKQSFFSSFLVPL